MMFALHTPHFMFCKGDLMIVNWIKRDVKGEKNKDIQCCF